MLSAERPRAVATAILPGPPASSGLRAQAPSTARRNRSAASEGGKAGGGGTGRDAGSAARVGAAGKASPSGAASAPGPLAPAGPGSRRLGNGLGAAADGNEPATGARGGVALRPCAAGGRACAPGDKKPCAWADGGSDREAAKATDVTVASLI